MRCSRQNKTQKFNRTKKEIKKLEDKIDKIANQLNEYAKDGSYPSFGKLKQYGKPYDNLMQLYQDYKLEKLRGEEIFTKGGRADRQPFAPDNESRVAGDRFNFYTKDLEQLPAVKRLQEDIESFLHKPYSDEHEKTKRGNVKQY